MESANLDVAGVLAEAELCLFQIGDSPVAEEETIHRDVGDSMLLVIAGLPTLRLADESRDVVMVPHRHKN